VKQYYNAEKYKAENSVNSNTASAEKYSSISWKVVMMRLFTIERLKVQNY